MRPVELKQFLKFAIPLRKKVLVCGPPGVGKTDIIKAGAAAAGNDLIITHPVIMEPTDIKGLPFPNGDHAVFLPYGQLKRILEVKKPTVVFLDDIGTASTSVQASLMQLLHEGRIDDHKVPDQVVFLAATNRASDRSGVSGILEAVKSRFDTIVNLDVNLDDWVEWANQNQMPPELASFVRFRPEMLHQFEPSREIKNYPCPRTLAHVGGFLNDGLPKTLEFEVIMGAAGESFAQEFTAFLTLSRKLPDPLKILTSPGSAPLFTKPDELYAICGALAYHVSEETLPNLVTYINRIAPEYAVLTMRDVIARKPAMGVHLAYRQWLNQEGIKNIVMATAA